MKLSDFIKQLKNNPDRLLTVSAFLVTYLLFFTTFLMTIRYSGLHLVLYFTVFAILFFMILILSLISFEGTVVKNKKMHLIGNIGLVLVSFILMFGIYYVARINASINSVIVDTNQSTEINTAFVSYDSTQYSELKDINNVKLGILSNSENTDRNAHVKAEVTSQSLNVTFMEYLSYNDMMIGLFNKDIQIAALPADYYNQYGDTEGYTEFLDKTTIVYSFTSSQEATGETVDIDVAKEPFSILIMGNDGGRTDSLILATYNPIKLSVTMTSIPRDSYVPIACYPNQKKDKLGHAFAVSQDCAIKTVENLFDLDISYYLTVNFQGVVDIVDALDKIWLISPLQFVGQNSSEERGHYTVWIPEGGFFATGEQALAFARERHAMPGGDYQRQENQQQVIRSIIDRTLSLRDPNKAISVLEAAGENIKTNMTLNQMIQIFNVLMKAMNKTSLEPAYVLDMIGSRVMGYSSYTYNDDFQLPLWISVPYTGSIKDNRDLILSNLDNSANLPSTLLPQFNAQAIFYELDYFSFTYNEKEVHEVLPDFMPTMRNNGWTLADALVWGQSRGIKITYNEIRVGNPLYTEDVEHNYIVGQSVRYGIKTSTFNSLTLDIVKHELDCKVEANMVYDECKYLLPTFTGEKIVVAKKWATDNGLTITYTIIPETDTTKYDKTKYGLVIAQTPETEKDFRTITGITFTIMDVYSVVIPNMSTYTEIQAKDWIKLNLFDENSYLITYVPTTDLLKVGLVASTLPASGVSMKVNNILNISVYALATAMPDFVTSPTTKTSVVSSTFCTTTTTLCTFIDVTTADATKVDTIASQSITAGSLKLNTEWATTNINFGVYKLAPTPTPSTP